MFIEAIKIEALTNSGKKYGCYVNFLNEDGKREINLIHGKNTLGKSTLLMSIVYVLGGEDIYGKSVWSDTNLKPIMKSIEGEEYKVNNIFLQLVNKDGERAIICRNALDREDSVIIYKDMNITQINNSQSFEFYKIKKDKGIQGNKTYQEFLFGFFKIPSYAKDDETQIYFQNLMPLFIVHQNAWNDIQATNPYYKIPEVKKIAFDMIMNLSETKNIQDKIRLRALMSELKEKNASIKDVSEIISTSAFKNVSDISAEIQKLENLLNNYESKIKEMEEGQKEVSNVLKPIKEKHKKLISIIKQYEEQEEFLEKEINEYSFYINKILSDIEKTDRLKTARRLISSLPIEQCPHCLNEITINEIKELETNHCSLCGSELIKKNYSKDEQLLGYLIDEKKDFEGIRAKKEFEKKDIGNRLFSLRLDLNEHEKTVNELETNLKPHDLQQYHYYSREIGRITNTIKNLHKEKRIVERYDLLLESIETLNTNISEIKKNISKKQDDLEDETKISYFQERFKYILKELDFLKDGFDGKRLDETTDKYFNKIVIDRIDYKPKIEGKNLYFLTSASGLIRIIISYYLALLETALHFNEDTNHPLLLIMDEPRQQNLDIETFKKFTNYLKTIRKKYKGKFQIIYASGELGTCTKDEMALDLGKSDFLIHELS